MIGLLTKYILKTKTLNNYAYSVLAGYMVVLLLNICANICAIILACMIIILSIIMLTAHIRLLIAR